MSKHILFPIINEKHLMGNLCLEIDPSWKKVEDLYVS
jgi:hypothetical protein